MADYIAARVDAGPGKPLIFTFHGTGGDETQFHGFAGQIRPDASVISPRGDVSEMGANRFFRRTGEGVYDMDDLAARTVAMARFMTAEVDRLQPSEVMALGYSNGANILMSVMLHDPHIVTRAALLHPLIPWTPAPVPELAHARILITAGERDPICPAETTRALERYLIAQGATPDMLWHPGGHEIAQPEVAAVAQHLG